MAHTLSFIPKSTNKTKIYGISKNLANMHCLKTRKLDPLFIDIGHDYLGVKNGFFKYISTSI
jgi:hypothetical protein